MSIVASCSQALQFEKKVQTYLNSEKPPDGLQLASWYERIRRISA